MTIESIYKRASSMPLPLLYADFNGSRLFFTSQRKQSNTTFSKIFITIDVRATGG